MIGERISKLRGIHNMTQEEFAEYMEVSRQSVSKWELDKSLPDIYKLLKMSELFQVSTDYILKGTEESLPEEEISVSDHDTQSEPDNATPDTTENRKKGGLKICLTFVSILFLICTILLCSCIFSQVWNTSGKTNTHVRVDAIYTQLTLADISVYGASGVSEKKYILLDEPGVRPGDYLYGYTNSTGEKLWVNYHIYTYIFLLCMGGIALTIMVLLAKEIQKREP